MVQDGLFIVIEGIDASGKATQTKRLVHRLRHEGYSDIPVAEQEDVRDHVEEEIGYTPDIDAGVWYIDFPTYGQTPHGRAVEQYLDGEFGDRALLPNEIPVLLYANDRYQFKDALNQFLDAGGIVVSDRYSQSNYAYQTVGYDGEKWEEMLEWVKTVDSRLPQPDEIFYIDLPSDVAHQRMDDREKDMHEEDIQFLTDVNANYRKIAKHEDWHVVPAVEDGEERTRGALQEELWGTVEQRL